MYGTKVNVRSMENRVVRYEEMPVVKGRILFYGHSLFTRCTVPPINHWGHPVLEEEVRHRDGSPAVLNHGFGTSCAEHLLYYYPRLVRPYEPTGLVLVSGSNDFAQGYSPAEVVEILARVVDYFQADFPGAPVYMFGYYPSLRNKGTEEPIRFLRVEHDRLTEDFCRTRENCHFVKLVDAPFFFENAADVGNYDAVREDIYCKDRTHFNTFGYTLFMQYIQELLSDIL